MFVVGAMHEERLTGSAGFYREKGLKTRHKGRIGEGSVRPGPRGVGMGKKMLRKVLERAAEMDGLEQVLLSVAAMQTVAFGLYRSLGFEGVGCEPRALRIGGRFIDEQYPDAAPEKSGPGLKRAEFGG
jgi:ribosomal protein S18 acetylase RimI-like enzyme